MMKKNQNKYLFNKRLEVLKFAKVIISERGFTSHTLKNISNMYRLDLKEIELLFPNGNNNLVEFALDQLNIELEDYCKNIDLISLPIHKRIRKILLSKI